MPPPRSVARSLRRTAAQVAKIPDDAIAAITTDVVEEAIQVGGTFTRRRFPLIAETRVRGGRNTRTAEVFGRPAGFWTIRTYGRDGMRVASGGFPIGNGAYGEFRASAGPAGPARRGRWDEVTSYTARRAPELWAETVEEAIADG